MTRAKNKNELLDAARENFKELIRIIDSLSKEELNEEFDFSSNPKLQEAHYKRDKNVRDILIHLYEWHQLLINWINKNKKGENISFLPEPYNWKTYPKMNIEFMEKHQNTSCDKAFKMLKNSHNEVIKIIEIFNNEELFTKKYFSWTGSTHLGSYCISSSSSHYHWAIKKLKKHKKIVSDKKKLK